MNAFDKLLEFFEHVKSLPKAINDLSASIREAAKRNRHEDDVDKERPIEVRFPENIERQRQAEHYQQIRVQWWIARGTWAAFIAASVYAMISCAQWREAHHQTVNTSRAWLGYQQIPGTNLPVAIDHVAISPHFVVQGHYTIENFGNGPAIKVTETPFVVTDKKLIIAKRTAAFICNSGVHFATGTVPMGPGLENPGPMGFVLFPKQTYSGTLTWGGKEPQPDLLWMYVMGCVAYLDQFKAPHWTRFVVLLGDGKNPVSDTSPRRLYSLYNDTDETADKDEQQ